MKKAVLFLFIMVLSSQVKAAEPPLIEETPRQMFLDLDAVVIGIIKPQEKYQLSASFRLETTTEHEHELRINVARIRNNIIMEINKYLEGLSGHKHIDFQVIKDRVRRNLQKTFGPDRITDVLVFSIYVR